MPAIFAQHFCFDAAVQTAELFNMSDDESNVLEYDTPAPVVEQPACSCCTYFFSNDRVGTLIGNCSLGTSSTGAGHRENS